jgi:flagellar biosynthesis protein FliR
LPTNPFNFDPKDVVAFVLILMRTAGIFLTAPVFASRNINSMVKASWILLVAFLIFPVVGFKAGILPMGGFPFAIAVIREMLIGFSIGLGATLLLTGIQLAGQIVDIQMGLGMVNIIDPTTSTQISVMGQYYYLIATLVFLAVDGHHVLLSAVVDSFDIIPLGQAHFSVALGTKMMSLFSQVFFVAFRVGAPVIGALFITNMALGIVARTVPQMNVFIVGMPLNLAVGFLISAASMSFFVFIMQGLFKGMRQDLAILIQAMK